VPSTDEQIRELERRLAAGDDSAWDELRRARNRAGRGKPIWMADLLEQGLREPVPVKACAVGVRAILEAAGIKKVRVRCYRPEYAMFLHPQDEATASELAKFFAFGKKSRLFNVGHISFILYPLGRQKAGSRGEDLGPKLAPEWQDVFLDGVRGQRTEFAKSRLKPVDRSFQRGDVVKLDVKGKRYVVGRVEPDGQLTIVPLTGSKGPSVVLVPNDHIMLDEDQRLSFDYKARERAYERLANPDFRCWL
jgi:hypothetical protein